MRKILILLTLCCALIACKRNEVEFVYSPEAPRAGQPVTFSNQSTSGEEWAWSFGDGVTSTLKSPTHTYKKPGKYLVTLQVDKKNAWKVAKEITIYDTVPSFTCADTIFYIYQDYTFTACIYNPYKYEVQYAWSFPANTPYVVMADENASLSGSGITLCFTQPMEAAPVCLDITLNGETTHIQKSFVVLDRPTHSLLMRTEVADYRQRIFGKRAEQAKTDATATALLNAEQDTLQTYNGREFSLTQLVTFFDGIQGFHIANRKLYYRADGLWVANIDGSNRVQIDTAQCSAMTLDMTDNRIYWATSQGVWYMPQVGSDNNKFVTIPQQLNAISGVNVLAADSELR
ncbi:MAG: PKD domain-containing protein [Paludibacteraceae bacterium]|nr:PKD domain-containing protein [Paludibacteraceae bacterium]